MLRIKTVRTGLLIAMPALACGSGASQQPPGTEPPGDSASARMTLVASGLQNPVHVTAPTGDDRLFVVEQRGTIRIIRNGAVLTEPFLDIRSKVRAGGEQGLLSVAFHPTYNSNGLFFVNYTDIGGDTRVERYQVGANRDVADPSTAKLILMVDQPFSNHNGGLLVFGPDGMLYIGMGDGGTSQHGQDRSTLLGAMLRVDVDGGDPYAVPPDNPFVGQPGVRPEIWAWGLRNPWRFAFDRAAGVLYIADVGQNAWEEINAVPAAEKGINYGWNIMEGMHCRAANCQQSGLRLPVYEYGHGDGNCSVTGGAVYRGALLPGLRGTYFFADYCRGVVRSFKYANGAVTEARSWDFGDLGSITSFGEDGFGELYLVSSNGRVYKLAPA